MPETGTVLTRRREQRTQGKKAGKGKTAADFTRLPDIPNCFPVLIY